MRLSISNIAWDITEDEAIARLLRRYSVDAIDIAPSKYFPAPACTTNDAVVRVRNEWLERGIEITGMQALLFGTSGLNVFGPPEVQEAMLQHFAAICRIGAGLGSRWLVFGSPKNRDRTGLSDQQAMDVAVAFFQRLGDIAQLCDVVICLEPNPACYGANFMTTSKETELVVRQIDHPCVRMQLDTGAITLNSEDPITILQDCASLIAHVHASEPELLPLGDGSTDHAGMVAALERYLPEHVVSIEMLPARNEPNEVAIERALNVAIRHYRHTNGGIKA